MNLKRYIIETNFKTSVASAVWANSEEEALEKIKENTERGLLTAIIEDGGVYSVEFGEVTYVN